MGDYGVDFPQKVSWEKQIQAYLQGAAEHTQQKAAQNIFTGKSNSAESCAQKHPEHKQNCAVEQKRDM